VILLKFLNEVPFEVICNNPALFHTGKYRLLLSAHPLLESSGLYFPESPENFLRVNSTYVTGKPFVFPYA